MLKEKQGLAQRAAHWLFSHPWLKLIALGLAVIVWFYVREEMARFRY